SNEAVVVVFRRSKLRHTLAVPVAIGVSGDLIGRQVGACIKGDQRLLSDKAIALLNFAESQNARQADRKKCCGLPQETQYCPVFCDAKRSMKNYSGSLAGSKEQCHFRSRQKGQSPANPGKHIAFPSFFLP